MLFYLFAISLLFYIYYYNITIQPLYLNDISIISQYRYLFLTIISLFLIFSYLFIITFKINIKDYSSLSAFPYLKEEIGLIIDTWGQGKLGINFINNLAKYNYYRYLYLFIDYLYFVVRLIIALFFIYFCFFNGNFYYLLYFSPIIFLFWLRNLPKSY